MGFFSRRLSAITDRVVSSLDRVYSNAVDLENNSNRLKRDMHEHRHRCRYSYFVLLDEEKYVNIDNLSGVPIQNQTFLTAPLFHTNLTTAMCRYPVYNLAHYN
jgi:hypothetical protein